MDFIGILLSLNMIHIYHQSWDLMTIGILISIGIFMITNGD